MTEALSLSTRLGDEFASGEADLNNPAQLASIPSPGDDIQSLSKAVRALKQVVDVLTGVGGSVLDKAPTVREMLLDGTLQYQPSTGLTSGVPEFISVSGPGGGGGYNDPRPILTTPPTITELEAWGAFKTVVLTWSMANYQNHAYVEVWRATADNLSLATIVGQPTANLYSDADVTVGQTYYYWVRAVNIEANVGAYNAVGGTVGALLRIGNVDLGDLVVEADNLASGAITGSKIAAGAIAVGSAAIANGAIRNALIENAAIDSAKISSLDAALVSFGTMSGDRIAANSLFGDRITSNSIQADRIAANTLTADRMAADLLSANNILTRGLTVRDLSGNIILSSGSAMSWAYVGLGKPVQYRVRSSGYTAFAGGKPASSVTLMDNNTQMSSLGSMYTVARFVRATGAFLSSHVYDPYGGGSAQATAMAGLLNGLDNTEIVVVYTTDEPQANRLTGGLDTAMYRCGASSGVFGASKFKFRSAYVLIGVPGCGAGNGYELYRGDVDSSADAFVETTFTIQAGQVNVNGMASQPFIDSGNASTYIANAAIGAAQIGSLNASVITAGTITTDKIQVGAVSAVNSQAFTYPGGSFGAGGASPVSSYDSGVVNVMTVGSTGAPLKLVGWANVSGSVNSTAVRSVRITVSTWMDGLGPYNSTTVTTYAFALAIGGRQFSASLPVANLYSTLFATPGSHTIQIRIAASWTNDSDGIINTYGNIGGDTYLILEENKV
jgi:hypothetical protein